MYRRNTPIGYTKLRFFGIEGGFDLHSSACGRTRRSCAECASNGSRNQHWYRDKYGALHGTRCGMRHSTTNDAAHGAANSTRHGFRPTAQHTARPSISMQLLIRLFRTHRTRQTQPSLRSDRLDPRSPSRFLRKRYHAFVFCSIASTASTDRLVRARYHPPRVSNAGHEGGWIPWAITRRSMQPFLTASTLA